MPWAGTRHALFFIGAAIGLASSGPAAQAEGQARPDGAFILAQQRGDQQQDDERKRHQRGQDQQGGQQHQQGQGGQQQGQGQGGQGGQQGGQQHQQGQQDQRHRELQFNQGQGGQGQGQGQGQGERKNTDRDRGNADRDRANFERERKLREEAEKDKQLKLKEQADKDRERKLKEQADKDRERLNAEKDKLKLKEQADKERELKLKEQADKERDRLRDKADKAKDKAADRHERFEEKLKDRVITREEREERRKERLQFSREKLQDVARQRHEKREGNRIIIEEPDARRIIKDQGKVIIRHDELARLRAPGLNIRVERDSGGGERTVIIRPGNVQIISIQDRDGRLVKRIKRYPNGREVILINNDWHRDRYRDRSGFGFFVTLPAFSPPERDYYIYADQADEDEMERVLSAPPVEDLREDYSLDEIRYSPDIRRRFRKLNLNVTFEFGSWEVRDSQTERLASVATAIQHILERNPDEMFLIAGHTDAVGSDEDNLSLSDRRAESVARVLTDEYGVPPENLVTQGYGESELLIQTQGPEERNRRVEIMRITNYLARRD